ncbi:MAG: PAS domain-containing protein [Bacteroidales bacterium]|jgi:PAS domain S-box-containing protein|nr:PAS domain-containing protein [Bacteroidales bacterium]
MGRKPSYSDLENKIQELEEKLEVLTEKSVEIEKHKKLIDSLIEGREKFRLIADFTYDWEYWLNPRGEYLYVSPSCKKITGYSPEEFISDPDLMNRIIHSSDKLKFKKYIESALELNAEDKQFEFRIKTRSTKQRWIGLHCQPVYSKDGKYLGQRASNRDITDLKQAEEKIKKAKKQQKSSQLEKEKFINDIDIKNRQLASFAMHVAQKNEVLLQIKEDINKLIDGVNSDSKQKLIELFNKIKANIQLERNWKDFKLHFENVHPGFFTRLNERFSNLTPKDQKLCVYLRMNFSTKEIAQLLSITSGSAEISRIRLRKKLNLSKETNLVKFITGI